MKLNKAAETARRIKKLASEIMEPWHKINTLILELDGNHNRLMGKGIKVKSHELYEILCDLAKEIEKELENQSMKKTEFDRIMKLGEDEYLRLSGGIDPVAFRRAVETINQLPTKDITLIRLQIAIRHLITWKIHLECDGESPEKLKEIEEFIETCHAI